MNEIIKAALDGLEVTIRPDCWPNRFPVQGIHVKTAVQTDNRPELNRIYEMVQAITWGEFKGVEFAEEYVNASVREMARVIRTQNPAGEWALDQKEVEKAAQARAEDAGQILRIVEDHPLTVDDVQIYAWFSEHTGLHGKKLTEFLREAITAKRAGKF